jgi:hypothetical protein
MPMHTFQYRGPAIQPRNESGSEPIPAYDTKKVARESIIDATAYPLLTEEVGFPAAPVAVPRSGYATPSRSGAGQGLMQAAASAVSDILGWKTNSGDPKGFLGALTQSFSLTEVEGHIESAWNPRSYTVQTDLAGGITGAQASLYTRAKDAQDQCLPLLDGLYPLDPDADPEYVRALREMAKSQIAEIVKEFGIVPPSILRVNTYFSILLGSQKHIHFDSDPRVESNPDRITGTLGELRDLYGIWFEKRDPTTHDLRNNPFSNSVEDEQDITNFRVISDYMTSLLGTWIANGRYFELRLTKVPAFLGTQLILMSRQFNVIVETVGELRFTLDSVFIGPNERQQLLLDFGGSLPSMYLEDILREVETFMSDEGPRLIRDAGRIGIYQNLVPVIETYIDMVGAAKHPANLGEIPDGYSTARVQNALDDLHTQLTYIKTLADQVGMRLPSERTLKLS